MATAALVAVWLVAILHGWFMVLESVLWTRPFGRRTFRMSREQAEATKVLASNQGVYNGMLAVGLVWASLAGNDGALVFLLVFVIVVGVYGAVTAAPAILLFQALPAAVALGLVLASGGLGGR